MHRIKRYKKRKSSNNAFYFDNYTTENGCVYQYQGRRQVMLSDIQIAELDIDNILVFDSSWIKILNPEFDIINEKEVIRGLIIEKRRMLNINKVLYGEETI